MTGSHPENPARIRAIEGALEERGWEGLEVREAPRAEREQLTRAHLPGHVDSIAAFCASGGGLIDADTAASEGSWEAALRAAGAACDAAIRLLEGEASAAFCGLRPPGHHAEPDRAMGFCLLNNAAVAARHAIASGEADRVLILDWDVHHGNGTEEIFKSASDVLYASIHQAPLYPGTGPAGFHGVGEGRSLTVNMPVPAGSGNEVFAGLVQHAVVPIAAEFRPDLIIVSAGYDAHRSDPLASCTVDEDGYRQMTAHLRAAGAAVGAPLLICLEGGYDAGALAASVVATLDALVDGADPRGFDRGPVEPFLANLPERWQT